MSAGRVLLDLDIPWATIDGEWYGIAVQAIVILYSFLGLAIVCDEHMVPALDTLCLRWHIPEDVAGATFMAFGSAAPEIIINVVATVQSVMSGKGGQSGDQTNLGVSAILGSGMIAFSMIPATCAMASKHDLLLKRRPLFRDEVFYLIALVGLIYIIGDGLVECWEGVALSCVYGAYLFTVIFASSIRECYRVKVLGMAKKQKKSFVKSKTMKEEQQPFLGASSRGSDADNDFENVHDSLDLHKDDDVCGDGSDDEEEDGPIGKFIHFIAMPLHFLFYITCPDASEGSTYEFLYGFTFFMTFLWVSIFSFLLSSVIERWVAVSGVSMAVFGLLLVSLGAEIPDTIESVTVAKKGYGSMAVSNCQGTQVINIAVGLGVSWAIASRTMNIRLSTDLLIPAYIQLALVCLNMCILLGYTVIMGKNKAVLDKKRAYALYMLYIAAIGTFIGIMYSEGKLFN